jgi:peptidoglycan/LPS O-acetylase OafA/YrhL
VTPTDNNLLATHIGSRQNSLDLIRLISASLVIIGHSYAIVGSGVDPMARWNGSVYTGLFALHVFFFISGLLVTNSFLHKPDIVRWLFSRVLRIFPALCVCLILTVFVLGSLTTTLPRVQYLTDRETWDYFLGNVFLLRTRYFLPGVFTGSVQKAMNGPLWSLYLEVRLYVFAAVLLWIFRGRPRQWLTAALGAVAVIGMLIPRSWLFVFGESEMHITCSVLFLMGALCALWSDKVLISTLWLVVIFLAANNYARTPAFPPLFLIFTCYFVLCFGFSKLLSAIRLPGDYSYGLYIYGWPVQQLVAKSFPHWPPPWNAASSFAIALGVAALSWHLIEKPSLAQKAGIGSPRQLKKAVAVAAGCAVAILIAIASGGLSPGDGPRAVEGQKAVEGLGTIEAFGPEEVVARKPFNVQPDGSSAMWVRLSSSVNARSSIVFRNFRLKTVVSGNLLTAVVPNELFAQPGAADIYVVDETYSPPRRTSSARLPVLSPVK